MKKIIFTLLCFAYSFANAQNLEYELIRTKESPGFFMIKIFPETESQNIHIEDVFVENFDEDQAERFAPLLKNLGDFGLKIMTLAELEALEDRSKYRIIFIGGKEQENYLHFDYAKDQNVFEAFSDFTDYFLLPIYMKNLAIEFGGNISDVYPKSIPNLTDTQNIFIGRFEDSIKTRLTFTGENQKYDFSSTIPLRLDKYVPHNNEDKLEEIWNALHRPQKEESISSWKQKILDFFPLILMATGLGLIAFCSFQFFKNRSS